MPTTIDVTDLVKKLQNTWVTWATVTVITAAKAVPWLSWTSLPVISVIFEMIVKQILTVVAGALEMQGFFINTAIRKASEAHDYVFAVALKDSLLPTATNEEYERAEQKEMLTFRNLVLVGSPDVN